MPSKSKVNEQPIVADEAIDQVEQPTENVDATAPDVADETHVEPEPEPSPATHHEPSTTGDTVRLGTGEYPVADVPIDQVQERLPHMEERIAALRTSQAIAPLQSRMLATEGQCALIVFCEDHVISGIEVVAAAMNLDRKTVRVVTVPPEDLASVSRAIMDITSRPAKHSLDNSDPVQAAGSTGLDFGPSASPA